MLTFRREHMYLTTVSGLYRPKSIRQCWAALPACSFSSTMSHSLTCWRIASDLAFFPVVVVSLCCASISLKDTRASAAKVSSSSES